MQLWLFIVASLIGGVLAAAMASFLVVAEVTRFRNQERESPASRSRRADRSRVAQ